jgi:hypothetical protein
MAMAAEAQGVPRSAEEIYEVSLAAAAGWMQLVERAQGQVFRQGHFYHPKMGQVLIRPAFSMGFR